DRGARGGVRRIRRVAGGAALAGLPRRALPLPRLGERRRGAAAPPAARPVGGRRRRADGAARARRALRRPRPAGGADVEGDAAAPRDRPGSRRRSAPPPARRADERARSLGPAHRSRGARTASGARPRGAPQLAPAERDRARVRPRRDHLRRPAGRRGKSRRALAGARRGGGDRRRHPPVRARHPGRRPRDRRLPGRRRGAGLRRPRARDHARGRVPGGRAVRDVAVIAGYALRESLRRKVFLVVLVLSLAFLALYGVGVWRAFEDTSGFVAPDQLGLDPDVVTGATVLGLAMFASLFLGTVLAIFLTLGVVRGDAERGLLQPLVVRPVGRSTLLLSRFLAAAAVCALYVVVLFTVETLITGLIGGWWPDNAVPAGAELGLAVVLVVALSLVGSIFLSSTANGIAVFMVFGGGLVAGLL